MYKRQFLDYIQDENHSILMSSHITTDLEKIADYVTFIPVSYTHLDVYKRQDVIRILEIRQQTELEIIRALPIRTHILENSSYGWDALWKKAESCLP